MPVADALAMQSEVEEGRRRGRTLLAGVVRFAARKPLGALGAFIIIVMLICAIFADRRAVTFFHDGTPLLAPYYYDDQNITSKGRLQPPSLEHPFGTDRLGRDQLSQIIYGARVSVVIGLSAVVTAAIVATLVGVLSAYIGGVFDLVVQRFVDAWISFPAIIILITGVQVAKGWVGGGATAQTFAIILVLAILLSAGSSRVIRGTAISVKTNQYVEAARVVGASDVRIVVSYILPNVMPVIVVLATVQLGVAILAEATISFLGFGVPAPFPSWGRMLSADGLLFMRADPWLAFWPGMAIFLAVYAFNMLGDAMRDVLDPRLRGAGVRR
jgi:peptide/nickel transport system permease protein